MDQVREQGDAVREDEDRDLRPGGQSENQQAECDRFDPSARTENRTVDEAMGVIVRLLAVVVLVDVTDDPPATGVSGSA